MTPLICFNSTERDIILKIVSEDETQSYQMMEELAILGYMGGLVQAKQTMLNGDGDHVKLCHEDEITKFLKRLRQVVPDNPYFD